jgi:hypothetical protein
MNRFVLAFVDLTALLPAVSPCAFKRRGAALTQISCPCVLLRHCAAAGLRG